MVISNTVHRQTEVTAVCLCIVEVFAVLVLQIPRSHKMFKNNHDNRSLDRRDQTLFSIHAFYRYLIGRFMIVIM